MTDAAPAPPDAGPDREAPLPPVAVVIPALRAGASLRQCLDAVLGQDYPGELEVAVAVGPSSDDTLAIAEETAAADARVRVVPNSSGKTPTALNAAIAATTAPIVARVDAHAIIPDGYLALAARILTSTGADNVGGVQHAVGTTAFERAVAAAMTSRFGVGNASFHFGGEAGPVDTVYLGVFRREALERVGGFDETLVRNQDYELNWRLRESGGIVWFDPRLRVRYSPRSGPRSLARQYYQYGRWKRVVLRRHPSSVRLRQLVPPAAVAANAAGLLLGITWRREALVIPGVYASAVAVAAVAAGRGEGARVRLRLPIVFSVMHHAWGWGFLTSPRRLGSGG